MSTSRSTPATPVIFFLSSKILCTAPSSCFKAFANFLLFGVGIHFGNVIGVLARATIMSRASNVACAVFSTSPAKSVPKSDLPTISKAECIMSSSISTTVLFESCSHLSNIRSVTKTVSGPTLMIAS